MIDSHHGWSASFKPQFIGFVSSFIVIGAIYFMIKRHHLAGTDLTLAILGLAVFQTLIQLVFFLHLGMEDKPKWNTIAFVFAFVVLVIIIGGSLWIMHNLNYNLMG